MILDIKAIVVKFLKFGIVGASGMVVDFGVLYIMRDLIGLSDILSNTISFTLAATSNYILNRLWTFHSNEQKVGVEYGKFLLVSVVGLLINNGVLLLSSHLWSATYDSGIIHISEKLQVQWFYVFKLCAIAITTLWNFFGNMLFTFRKK